MEAPGSPREASPAIALLTAIPPNPLNRKRKLGAVASVAASSPAPSERANTPNPATDDIVVPAKHADLTSRPRLTISRHPQFIPIAPGSPYCTTEPLCNNRLNFRYTPAGLSAPGSSLPFRTIESAPACFRVSWEDRSTFVKVTQDGLGLQGERGFRSARCNAPIREGKWYMEIKIEAGGGDNLHDLKCTEGSHVRLGWARREAPLNAPAGLDGYSYAFRDKTGDKVHLSRPRPYGKPFKSGDVVGMYISLPPHRQPNPRDPHDPAHIKRERIAIEYKGQEYFESLEYSQSKEMMSFMDSKARDKANSSAPAPTSTKKSATVKNLPSASRGSKTGPPEPPPMRLLPTLGPESYIAFFVNGESQGIAFQDLYDYLPLRSSPKKGQDKKRSKEGVREHKENLFDDGTLGYYPLISLFNEARVRINPGPDFEFPPPPDIDSVLTGSAVDLKPSEAVRTWRPIQERYPEYIAEQTALDEKDEVDAQTNQHSYELQVQEAQEEDEKAELRRVKRRAQAAARKERKQREKEMAEAVDRNAKRKRTEEPVSTPAESDIAPNDSRPFTPFTPSTSAVIAQEFIVGSFQSGVDQAYSPAPPSSVDGHTYWHDGGHDTSEYNSEYGELPEEEEVDDPTENGPIPLVPNTTDLSIEDEIALAAGESTLSNRSGLGITFE
ncbi:hypothetical protein QCA50_007816 [Cerrena zonata]|uniref:B30.2/SPRY domain-containing protein n=1 Tax=Cerrena zonata TaxID=2478898 RepID=A0AAW0GJB9_9APHY